MLSIKLCTLIYSWKSLLVVFKKKVIQLALLIILLSSSSCSYHPIETDKRVREKLTQFFEELLLEHGGAYTLLGTKPITVEALIDTSEEAFNEMENYLEEHPEIDFVKVDRQIEEGWKIWKKLSKKPISKNFILTEIKYENYDLLVFVNVKSTLSHIQNYYYEFENILGDQFDPKELIESLKNGKSEPWKKIFQDYTLMGILFGYGYENGALFEKRVNGEIVGDGPSENNDPRLTAECYLHGRPFRIPIFSMLDKKKSRKLVQKYKKERSRIKKLYEERDFLEVTFANLQKPSTS